MDGVPKISAGSDFVRNGKIDTEFLNINTENSWNEELDSNFENYYYFNPSDLEKYLGLKGQDLNVIINFETRNIISSSGVKQGEKFHYRQYDLRGGEQLFEKIGGGHN